MTIEVDLKEIKHLLSTLNEKIDVLLEERDNLPLMALAEGEIAQKLPRKETDIYSIKDIKTKVSCS